MATCFVIILSVVVFSCSCQSSNTGYSSKGILLQVSSHLSVCVWRCIILSGWVRSSDQSVLTWTVFIKWQSSSLLCLWFWLKVGLLWSSESSRFFLWGGGGGGDSWKREAERGLNHLYDPLPGFTLCELCVLPRGQRWNDEYTVAGCLKGFGGRFSRCFLISKVPRGTAESAG